jgi:hypothetical protein
MMKVTVLVAVASLIAGATKATGQGAQTATAGGTLVSGVVFDSLAMRGLAGATVQIADASGKPYAVSVTSDASGHFSIPDVPIGTYLLGYFHPKLDSIGIASPTFRVDVRTSQPVQARLAVPSAPTLVHSVCGAKSVADSTGLLLGYVRGADNSMPRVGSNVTVRWTEIFIEKQGIRRVVPTAQAATGSTGMFAVCGVPLGTPIVLQAALAADSSGPFEITVPRGGLLYRDIFIAPFTRTRVSVSDSAPPVEMLRGNGRLRGQVLGTNGRPLGNARVMLWGTGIESTTGPDGQFTLAGLPGGTHTLEARAVGFTPAQIPVDIVQGRAGEAAVELANLGITLDTVRVSAQRLYTSGRTADFERRLRTGLGHVIDENEIEKRKPMVLTDLLRTVPGIQILPGKRANEDIYMRGGQAILGGGLCRPDIRVDGVQVANDELFPVNSIVGVDEIRAVEVYAHASMLPTEYQTLSGCGVIAIWTGARKK